MNLSDRLGDAAVERAARSRVRFQPLDEPVEPVQAIDLTGDVARVHTAAPPPGSETAIDLREGPDHVEIILPLAGPQPPAPPQARVDSIEAPPAPPSPDATDSATRSLRPRALGIFAWLRLAQSRPNRPHRRCAEPSQALVPVSTDLTRPTSPLPVLRPVAFEPVVRTPPTVHLCPACGEEGRVDIDDPNLGETYLSCPNCFKMWQVDKPRTA